MDVLSRVEWRSLPTKTRNVFKTLTVEPMAICYSLAGYVSYLAFQQFYLEKACRVKLELNGTLCSAMLANEGENDHYCEKLADLQNKTGPDPWRDSICRAELAAQYVTTSMDTWRLFVTSLPTFVMLIFIGSWSDRHRRRKPIMFLPIIADIIAGFIYILCAQYFMQTPIETTVIADIISGLSGSWYVMNLAVFSYVADVTTIETRTLRIGIVNVFFAISSPLGTLVSGNLLRMMGYIGVFSVAIGLNLLALFLGWKLIPNSIPLENEGSDTTAIQGTKQPKKHSRCTFLKDFFHFGHVRETLEVAFKSGHHNHRLKVVFILITVTIILGTQGGEMNVLYNFTRLKFNWNEVDYSYFLTFIMIINLIGTSITVGVFSHMLKMDDAIIGIISCMSKILAGFIYAFARTTWVMYLAPLVDIANGTSYIAMRSIASKLVPADELGKLNSVFGMAEAIVPVIYGPMYNAIYNATRQSLPGAFYLVGGALTAPAVFIFLWLYGQHKQDAARLAKENSENEKGDAIENTTNIEVEKEKNGTMEMVNMSAGGNSHSNEGFQQENEN